MENDLAVRLGLEVGAGRAQLAESLVVVDLSVDGQNKGLVVVGQGLGTRLYLQAKLYIG